MNLPKEEEKMEHWRLNEIVAFVKVSRKDPTRLRVRKSEVKHTLLEAIINMIRDDYIFDEIRKVLLGEYEYVFTVRDYEFIKALMIVDDDFYFNE